MTLWLGKLEVQAPAARPRPHQGRHGRLAAAGEDPVQPATWSSSAPRRTPATPTSRDWPETLDNLAALDAEKLVPGRGAALQDAPSRSRRASTARAPSSPTLYASVQAGRRRRARTCARSTRRRYAALKPKYGHWVIFDHCMPFDVTRAYDEATQYPTRASGPPSATRRCGSSSEG